MTVTRYHPVLVALHWALAGLMIADLTIGTVALVHIPNDVPRKVEALRAHMSGGLLILALLTIRLGIRLSTSVPPDAATGSTLLDRVAWLSHRLLYVAAFGMALSGLTMAIQAKVPEVVFLGQGKLPPTFWVYPLRYLHFFFARMLMALIALHVTGALYHLFVRRDGLFGRMWFGRRIAAPSASFAKAPTGSEI
jgi:cytochrome b561